MGLSISRSIFQFHDGRICATANDGGPGATFSFSLPCRRERRDAAALATQYGADGAFDARKAAACRVKDS